MGGGIRATCSGTTYASYLPPSMGYGPEVSGTRHRSLQQHIPGLLRRLAQPAQPAQPHSIDPRHLIIYHPSSLSSSVSSIDITSLLAPTSRPTSPSTAPPNPYRLSDPIQPTRRSSTWTASSRNSASASATPRPRRANRRAPRRPNSNTSAPRRVLATRHSAHQVAPQLPVAYRPRGLRRRNLLDPTLQLPPSPPPPPGCSTNATLTRTRTCRR